MPSSWSLPEALKQVERLASEENCIAAHPSPATPMRGVLVRRNTASKAKRTPLLLEDESGTIGIERSGSAVLRRWKASPPTATTVVSEYIDPHGVKQGLKGAWHIQLHMLVTKLGARPEAFLSRSGLVRESSSQEGQQKELVMPLQDSLASLQRDTGLDEATLWEGIDALAGTVLTRVAAQVPVWEQKDRVVARGSAANPMRGVLAREAKLEAFQLIQLEVVVDGKQKPWLRGLEAEPEMVARQPVEYSAYKSAVEGIFDVVTVVGQQSKEAPRGASCPYVRVRSL
jgi:hypothetical protein